MLSRGFITAFFAILTFLPVYGQIPPSESLVDPQDFILTYITPFDCGAVEEECIALVHKAKHTIRVAAYGFTDPELTRELILAKQRGVDVAIVMDSTQAAGKNQRLHVDNLRKAGVDLRVGKSIKNGALLHAKFIVVDHMLVLSGSWNFSGKTANSQFNEVDIVKSETRAQIFEDAWSRIYYHLAGRRHVPSGE